MSTSGKVRYIHSLWRHISSTEFRLLGLLHTKIFWHLAGEIFDWSYDEIDRLISFAPRLLTLVIRMMSLKRNKQRSFLIQGLALLNIGKAFVSPINVLHIIITWWWWDRVWWECEPEPPNHCGIIHGSWPPVVSIVVVLSPAHCSPSQSLISSKRARVFPSPPSGAGCSPRDSDQCAPAISGSRAGSEESSGMVWPASQSSSTCGSLFPVSYLGGTGRKQVLWSEQFWWHHQLSWHYG